MITITSKIGSGIATKQWDLLRTMRSIHILIDTATAVTIKQFSIATKGEAVTWTNGRITCRATGPEDEMKPLRRIAQGFAEIMENGGSSPAAKPGPNADEDDPWGLIEVTWD